MTINEAIAEVKRLSGLSSWEPIRTVLAEIDRLRALVQDLGTGES